MEEMIDNTLAETGADEFSIFLSGPTNFRNEIYPEYKANRKAEKPRHLAACKDFLIEKYKAEVSDGCEADDLLGIAQDKFGEDHWTGTPKYTTIICGLDKDLLMIPGKHYSFAISGKITRGANAGQTWERPARFDNVEPFDGLRRFYKQVLTGDSTDNIKGASGIGEVKADRILADCTTERELFEAVSSYFSSEEELLMTGQCIWIWRKPNDRWRIPKFE
jgi:5'-3' exonuclease